MSSSRASGWCRAACVASRSRSRRSARSKARTTGMTRMSHDWWCGSVGCRVWCWTPERRSRRTPSCSTAISARSAAAHWVRSCAARCPSPHRATARCRPSPGACAPRRAASRSRTTRCSSATTTPTSSTRCSAAAPSAARRPSMSARRTATRARRPRSETACPRARPSGCCCSSTLRRTAIAAASTTRRWIGSETMRSD